MDLIKKELVNKFSYSARRRGEEGSRGRREGKDGSALSLLLKLAHFETRDWAFVDFAVMLKKKHYDSLKLFSLIVSVNVKLTINQKYAIDELISNINSSCV